jgi:hypothetical protein
MRSKECASIYPGHIVPVIPWLRSYEFQLRLA